MSDRAFRIDIWGGENSQDHLARMHTAELHDGWQMRIEAELRAGFLVNIRMLGPGEGWGPSEDFDHRHPAAPAGHA